MKNQNENPEDRVKNQPYAQQAYGYLKRLWTTSTKHTHTESKPRLEKSSKTMLETKPKEKAMKAKSNRDVSKRIRAYIKQHPTARPAHVAKELGVSPQAVYSVRYEENKKKKVRQKKVIAAVFDKTMRASAEIVTKLDAGANGTSAVDMVNHPPHYKVGGIETIQFIKAKLSKEEYVGYLRGNVLKYASRLGAKSNAPEDAGKMAWYSNELAKALKG